MRQISKWLGFAGSWTANILTWFGVPGAVAASAILSFVVAGSDKISSLAQTRSVQTGAAVFLFSLWTYIGLYIVALKSKPLMTKRVRDIKYGLSITHLFLVFDKNNELALQFGVNLQNYSGETLRYNFNKFDVVLKSRIVGIDKMLPAENIITFGGSRGFYTNSYPKSEIESFFGKDISGTVEIELDYGPLDSNFKRRLVEKCNISLRFGNLDAIGLNERITVYKEEDI